MPQEFGIIANDAAAEINSLIKGIAKTAVRRKDAARSKNPFPASTDLERAIKPWMTSNGFVHHAKFTHPVTERGFEYDFFKPKLKIAVEVMGYRADDEVYKNILKFHVHSETRVGVVLVPRWKWLGTRKTSTNYDAALKALSFANTFMNVDALIAIAYDWNSEGAVWRLVLENQ